MQIRLSREVFNNALAVDKLLDNNALYAKHGKTAVVKLLGAESNELILVGGGKAKRIEAEIAIDLVKRTTSMTIQTGLSKHLSRCTQRSVP